MNKKINPGDYVLATRWSDGDPLDPWVVGFYKESYLTHRGDEKYIIVDIGGKPFWSNGFRRIKKISQERGNFIIDNMDRIQETNYSLWWWVRVGMAKITHSYPKKDEKIIKFLHDFRAGKFN